MDPRYDPPSPIKKKCKVDRLRRTSWRYGHFVAGLAIGLVSFLIFIIKKLLTK